ncbi:MAG TPA: hypothetical protein VM223_01570, partial [Planctomycetota bacterium]|nr:hypothetical protein [Planctomycetota bacterium]
MANTGAIRAGKAYVELGTDNKNLEKGLKAAQRRLREFGSTVRAAGTWLFAAGGGILGGLGLAAKTFADYGDSLSKMSQRTGLGVEALSKLAFMAQQSGSSLEVVEMGVRVMQRSIYDASQGLKTATDAFAELGMSVQDLQGLAPEKQFNLLAERLAGVEDATFRAAIAQKLFGRSGTQLLPLFASGAAGIRELNEQIERFGLIITEKDVAAAVALKNKVGLLFSVFKAVTFKVGAALAGRLGILLDSASKTIARIGMWLERSPGWVISVAKLGVVLAGAGIAGIVLGQSILVVSSALTALVAVFPLVAAGLGFIFSPAGLIAVGVVGAMAALTWLTGGFRILAEAGRAAAEDFRDSFVSMGDALAAGDIGLAARIFWLTLKFEWTRGIGTLRGLWATFRYATLSTMATIVYGLRAEWEIGTHAILRITYGLARALRSVWRAFFDFFRTTHDAAVTWIAKRIIDVQGLFDKALDTAAIKAGLDEQHAAFAAELDQQQAADEKRWNAEMARDQEAHKRRLAAIGEEADLVGGVVRDELLTKLNAIDDEVLAARRAWKQSQADARAAREKWKMEAPGAPPGGPSFDLSGIQEAIRNTISTIGAFQVESVLGLKAGSATDRIANGIDKIERNTRSLKDVD